MKLLRSAGVVWLLAMCMVVVAACGGSAATTQESGGGKASAPEQSASGGSEAAEKEPVELTFWMNWKQGSAYTGMYYDRVHQFMEEHPNITLKIEQIPYIDYNLRIQTAAAGKQLPDIMQFISGGPLLETIAKSGALQPYDEDFVNEWKDTKIPASLLKQFEVDGKQYGIPAEANYGSMVFYNKKMLADAGFNEFPKTFEELLALVEALKAQDITPFAVGNLNGDILSNSFLSIISDRVIGEGSLVKLANKEIKFTDPEFVAALSKIKELADAGAFNQDANTIESIESTDRFLAGEMAIAVDGSWAISQIMENKPDDFELGIAVMPAIEGGKGDLGNLSSVTNQAVVMNANLEGAKKEAAETFIRYMFSDELFEVLVASSFPITSTAVPVPEDAKPEFKQMMELAKTITTISPTAGNALPPTVFEGLKNGLQGLIMKGGDPVQLAEDLQKLME